jgi:hypothetical protein
MKQRSSRGPFLLTSLWLAALPLLGCSDDSDEPCPGVVVGATYEVDVVEPSEPAVPADCHLDWALPDGAQLLATVNETYASATCSVATPELSGLEGWSFELLRTEAASDGFMKGNYEGTLGDCRASVTMKLGAGTNRACFQSSSEASAECELLLDLYELSGDCPERCTTRLAVNVTRQ